jgi:hypothetical protein
MDWEALVGGERALFASRNEFQSQIWLLDSRW